MYAAKGDLVDIGKIAKASKKLVDNVEIVIKGKREAIELAVIAFICRGHLLIEDVPGVGKTMLARAIAKSVNGTFRRIQFTPDLLPSDITGTSLFNQKIHDFQFSPGPIFANIVLADEINRTTPRTQSALLEAMDEYQVTVDGVAHLLPEPFFVIATQNPIEYHGTYPLPEGQLDRFLMSINLGYPEEADEKEIIKSQRLSHPIESISSVLKAKDLLGVYEGVKHVHISESLVDYVLKIVTATRDHRDLVLGASPRGSLAIIRTAQGAAAIEGRDYVLPDDIKKVAPTVLAHRVMVKPQLRLGKSPGHRVISSILDQIEVPLK